ncbi:hypothetical protein [Lactiplantibacillus pentosus]|uniref:hypothetical protein n=1 Tax=Lactiplantibacillus pentosus TaxID=1589 RepID=UPI0015E61547|nr:hypothetical protein [Lactiplantibacillus pentosus]
MIKYERLIPKVAWVILFADVFLKPQSMILKAFLAISTITMIIVLIMLKREKKAMKK